MNKSSKKNRCTSHDCLSKKLGFGQRLGEIWRDLQDEAQWKYERLSPVQLLEKSQLHAHLMNNDELARASWFWSRRPRFLQAGSTVIWIIVALGLPLWLSIGLVAGLPLIIAAVVIVEIEIVRSVRWRRQYELSIDRLIRTSTNDRDTFGVDVLA
jgi:hypothetical protein